MDQKKKYRVVVSDRAKQMLETHIRFLARVNKEAAAAKKKELFAAMRSLSQMPQRFPLLEGPDIPPSRYHKMFVGKWFLIRYYVGDDVVHIEYINDGREEPLSFLS